MRGSAAGSSRSWAAWLGDAELATEYRGRHARAAEAHNRVFWNEAESLYSDWIDVHGDRRHYFYTDHNLMAVIQGVAGPERSRRILRNLDEHYARLCRDYKVSRDAIYATPCNMRPVSQLGDMVDFGRRSNQTKFPNYENGCSFFHSTGLEIAARAGGWRRRRRLPGVRAEPCASVTRAIACGARP